MLKQKMTEILIRRTWSNLYFRVYWEKISDIVMQIISEKDISHELKIIESESLKITSCNISPTKSISYLHFMYNGKIRSFNDYICRLGITYPTISLTEYSIHINFDRGHRLLIKSEKESLISLTTRIISFDPETQEEFLGIEGVEFLDEIENENGRLTDIISNFV